ALMERQLNNFVPQVGRFFFRFLIANEFNTDHQALPAHLPHDFVPPRPIGGAAQDEFSYLPCVQDIFFFEEAHRGERRGNTHGITAEGGCVGARLPIHHAGACDHSAQRKSGSNAFRYADDVRLDTGVVHGPPFASAAHTRLHFVRNKHNAVLLADALQSLKEFGRRENVAAFTLNRLDEDARDFFGIDAAAEKLVFEIVQTVCRSTLWTNSVRTAISVWERNGEKTRQQRAKCFALD